MDLMKQEEKKNIAPVDIKTRSPVFLNKKCELSTNQDRHELGRGETKEKRTD
jgi:hypothetical protein